MEDCFAGGREFHFSGVFIISLIRFPVPMHRRAAYNLLQNTLILRH
nr:MAG TPA: hypothetical protein [Caudoviricetes sp.]